MATLTIRNLPDEVRDRLRIRAAENGRSMEAEARAILKQRFAAPVAMTEDERMRRVRSVQEALKPYRPEGMLLSDELMAERRLEAWTETVEALQARRRRVSSTTEAAQKKGHRGRSRSS